MSNLLAYTAPSHPCCKYYCHTIILVKNKTPKIIYTGMTRSYFFVHYYWCLQDNNHGLHCGNKNRNRPKTTKCSLKSRQTRWETTRKKRCGKNEVTGLSSIARRPLARSIRRSPPLLLYVFQEHVCCYGRCDTTVWQVYTPVPATLLFYHSSNTYINKFVFHT